MQLPSFRPAGIELPQNWRVEALSYETYMVPSPGGSAGEVHWFRTADPRIRAGVWRIDAQGAERPVPFVGHEAFQVIDGYAEVVVDGQVMMALQPGDVGCIPEALVTDWWIAGQFAKFLVLGGGTSLEEMAP